MSRLRTESSIEGTCRDRAAADGFILLKLHHGIVGMPDRLLICPDAPDIFIEFKRGNAQLERIQKHWCGMLMEMGKRVEIVRTVKQFERLLTQATEHASIHAPRWSGPEE